MPHICVIAATFYEDIASELLLGAKACLESAAATWDIVHVPGAFEIPATLGMAIAGGKYDGYVVLGCVIRGETTHYDYVCRESARGINELAIRHKAAVGYGILTVENVKQAWVRAATTQGDKGGAAAKACLAMIEIRKKMGVK